LAYICTGPQRQQWVPIFLRTPVLSRTVISVKNIRVRFLSDRGWTPIGTGRNGFTDVSWPHYHPLQKIANVLYAVAARLERLRFVSLRRGGTKGWRIGKQSAERMDLCLKAIEILL